MVQIRAFSSIWRLTLRELALELALP